MMLILELISELPVRQRTIIRIIYITIAISELPVRQRTKNIN